MIVVDVEHPADDVRAAIAADVPDAIVIPIDASTSRVASRRFDHVDPIDVIAVLRSRGVRVIRWRVKREDGGDAKARA